MPKQPRATKGAPCVTGGWQLRSSLLSDELWEEIEPFVPPPKPRRPKYPHREYVDARRALTGILIVLQSGIGWEALSQELGCGSGVTCWRRLRDWQEMGVWEEMHRVLLRRLPDADRFDWSRTVGS
jgi:transposase